ncbi:MAG TPA: cytochrome c oxidase subunit II [Gemmatimonadales bacterium]|nr:cytochrome c oxidase subunit II [Gemmatimonadales bacterium]
MPFETPTLRRLARVGGLACLLALVVALAGCSPDQYPQSALHPRGDFARMVDGLFHQVLFWATVVFVLVEGALIYVIFRYRGKPDDPEPEQTHGNTTLEIVWTMVPAIILAMIAVPTVKAIFVENSVPTNNPLTVQVIGHQWWWEFRYPEYGITTANELHIPVGRTVSLRMGTSDVVHSFWTPQLAGKRDVFPNRETRLWFTAEAPGYYRGQCAEFCGIQHAKMAFHIVADSPEQFDAYVKSMQATGTLTATGAPRPAPAPAGTPVKLQGGAVVKTGLGGPTPTPAGPAPQAAPAAPADTTKPAAPTDPVLVAGNKLFLSKGCVGCHALTAVNVPAGMVGPNLAHIGTRRHIAAGMIENTDANLAHWIRVPQEVKKGVLMPNLGLTEQEAQQLVAYFRALAKQ